MRQQLREFIQDELLDGTSISDDQNLLVSGLVDSMGMMRLIAFIDQQLEIAVPPEDVTIENFTTVDQIVQYLDQRVA